MLEGRTTTRDPVAVLPSILTTRRLAGVARLSLPAKISLAFIGLLIVVALAAPILPLDNPLTENFTNRLQVPLSSGHLLGTDELGRDIFSRIIWGSRTALLSGFVPVLLGSVIGAAIGVVSGMARRSVRSTMMRVLDVFFAFPALLLAIVVATSLGAGLRTIIIAITVVVIPPVARIADVETNRLSSAEFVIVAASSGVRKFTIVWRHVLPNVIPTLIVYCTSLVGLAIVYSSGLSFLGLGVAAPTPDWGAMVSELRDLIFTQPLLSAVPAVAIFLVSIAFNVLGDGLRDALAIGKR